MKHLRQWWAHRRIRKLASKLAKQGHDKRRKSVRSVAQQIRSELRLPPDPRLAS